MRHLVSASAAMCVVFACGAAPTVTVAGTARVPVAVQQRFSAGSPGQVVVEAELQGAPPIRFRAGVLCDADAADQVIAFEHTITGCATQALAQVRVWVAPRADASFDFCDLDGGVGPWPLDVASGAAVAAARQSLTPRAATHPLNTCATARLDVEVTVSEE